jgi:hypothetical protein
MLPQPTVWDFLRKVRLHRRPHVIAETTALADDINNGQYSVYDSNPTPRDRRAKDRSAALRLIRRTDRRRCGIGADVTRRRDDREPQRQNNRSPAHARSTHHGLAPFRILPQRPTPLQHLISADADAVDRATEIGRRAADPGCSNAACNTNTGRTYADTARHANAWGAYPNTHTGHRAHGRHRTDHTASRYPDCPTIRRLRRASRKQQSPQRHYQPGERDPALVVEHALLLARPIRPAPQSAGSR